MEKCLKTICSLAIITLSFMVISSNAFANCEVKLIQVGSTELTVDGAGDPVSGHLLIAQRANPTSTTTCLGWSTATTQGFHIAVTNGDAMLATALTALSLGKTMTIACPSDTFPNYQVIDRTYVKQ